MPRKLKLGRTGAKHEKPAAFDARRQPKAEGATSCAHETLSAALEATNAAMHAADAAVMPPPPPRPRPPLPVLPVNPLNLRSVRERKRKLSVIERVRAAEVDLRLAQGFRQALWERGSNDWCECAGLGYSGSGHHFACPIYKCYAYEIGCCEGLWETPDRSDYWECECMASGFSVDVNAWPATPRERFTRPDSKASEEGFWPRGCAWLENEYRPCWGRSMKPCPRECPCHEACGGRYIPVCPFRPHGVSGRPRGEVIAEMKGHCISMQWHGEFVPDFGEHLPRLPTS